MAVQPSGLPVRLLLLACWLTGAAAATAQPFVRDTAPFAVLDESGTPFAQPFLGGFDTPRPTLGDVTGDGLPDLLVIEQSGAAMLFENTSTPGVPSFAWRTDRFADLDTGTWMRVFDGDGDGDLDVLAEQPFGYARYYRNDADAGFTQAIDTLRDATGARIAALDSQNLPALGDVTCDGRDDLLAAQIDGSLTVYPGLAPQAGLPRFDAPIENFGDILVQESISKNADAKHGASTLEAGDVDGDGDLDLIWGNFFSEALILIRNATGCPNPTFVRDEASFPTASFATGGYNAAAWGDVDGDGIGDVVVGTQGGAFTAATPDLYTDVFFLFSGAPDGTFALSTSRLGSSLDVGTVSRVAAGDMDGDGDLDLLVSTQVDSSQRQGRLFAWENVGTRTAPRFAPRTLSLPADTRYGLAPALGDLDGDGDLDLLVGGFDGSVTVLRATGPFAFEVGGEPLRIPRGSNAAPALGDLDGDGDLDLLVGENSGDLNAFRNDGTAAAPAFTLTTEALLPRPGQNVAPTLTDLDGDGDLDLYVGTQDNGLVMFINTGTPADPIFTVQQPFVLGNALARRPAAAAPAFADFDGDGDLDLLSGAQGGGAYFYRNDRIQTAAHPAGSWTEAALLDHRPVPNPSSGTVTLQFTLTAAARVEGCVFDVLGRKVACTSPRWLGSGAQILGVDLSGAAAGLYVYRLRANAQQITGTLLRQP